MKRLSSSDSLGALMSICPNSTDEHNQGNNPMYTREFQTMMEGLDEEGCVEESGHVSDKKRRLSVDQVKALEKNFEIGELKSKLNQDGNSESKVSDAEVKSKHETQLKENGTEISFETLNGDNNGGISTRGVSVFESKPCETTTATAGLGEAHKNYHTQFVKIEEHNFFGEESCTSFFTDDQAPTLPWYCSDDWN
ncbi:Homeobox-leucine zipper protein ATHB-6 [Sesamum angolense]|uniref:Homeobox-leucine zipper protein ATHB-6 n=1 Tax=Sesamum angolense TaxID=2727404 RepID=A0AAE1XGY4_9LAMI|nr:Homeobox-leucine zipper protein ATHB-6 [Sesamum angolense]